MRLFQKCPPILAVVFAGVASAFLALPQEAKANTPPVADDLSYTTFEDAFLGGMVSGTDADDDQLTFSLLAQPAAGSIMLNLTGSFGYSPLADFNGVVSFTYQANDALTNSQPGTVTLTVLPVNDPPSFVAGPDIALDVDAGPQTIPGWATSLSAGPPDEAGQVLSFHVSNDNPGLFDVPPSIDSSGTLSFTPVPEFGGRAIVTVTLMDDGGTNNMGIDQSAPVTFSILICSPVIVVTTPAPDGPGSLRQAILDANTCDGPNVILFDLPGPGPHTINPVGGLPAITGPLMIDGWSQPGFAGTPVIELDGSASPTTFGLDIRSHDCVVRGLAINGFLAPGGNGFGIRLFGPAATDNWIYGCFIGTDPSGLLPLPNGRGGIWIAGGSTRNLIGTDGDGIDDDVERNVVSGNVGHGILVQSGGNVIAGNYIGTDVTGLGRLQNTEEGVFLSGSGTNLIGGVRPGTANIISGNSRNGILIRFFNADHNRIIGNLIGLAADGSFPIPNRSSGIAVSGAVRGTVIGTDGDGHDDVLEANVISGNRNDGVTLGFVIGDAPPFPCVVAGNFIGTDRSGSIAVPNGDSGVYVLAGSGHRIGTDADGVSDTFEGNVLSGNIGAGVTLDGMVDQAIIAGNLIGPGADGSTPVGNMIAGVRIINGAAGNTIGGDTPVESNVIAHNGAGVVIGSGTANLLSVNAIRDNAGLGIDLNGDGVTANDPLDSDAGANNSQNHPQLGPPMGLGQIPVQLNSTPDTTFVVQFFANATCDGSGFGEAEAFLQSLQMTTDASGAAATMLYYVPVPGKPFLTATATDPNGNTSELSPCVLGNNPPVAVPQTASTAEDTDLLIALESADVEGDSLAASVVTLPSRGALYQFDAGGRGVAIITVPATVTDPAQRLIYSPPADANGDSFTSFEFSVRDTFQDSVPAQVSIGVLPVNDPPTFVKGPAPEVNEDAGPQVLPNWVTQILAGPADEQPVQTLTVMVDYSNPGLFSAPPEIIPDGTLTFTPTANAHGEAVVTLTLMDDGGTDLGGLDRSAPESFTITVRPVNDCPNATPQAVMTDENGTAIVLGGSDIEEDALSYTVTRLPEHGTLTGTAPNLFYTPNPDYCDTDSFVFSVTDGDPDCAPAEALVKITILCGPPPCPVPVAAVVPPVEIDGTNFIVVSPNNFNAPVIFDASGSSDPLGAELSHLWFEAPPPDPSDTPQVPGKLKSRSNPQVLPGDCGLCQGEVTQLTLQYNGSAQSEIEIFQHNQGLIFEAMVEPGQIIELLPVERETFGKELLVFVDGQEHVRIRTNCSEPIGTGLVYGDFVVTDGFSRDGGRLCQLAALPLRETVNFGDGVVARRDLFLGVHTIVLLTDNGSCMAEDIILVQVITAGEAVEACKELIVDLGISPKQARQLTSALENVRSEFDKGKFFEGEEKLKIYVKKVLLLVEKERIDAAHGAILIDCAERLLRSIELR